MPDKPKRRFLVFQRLASFVRRQDWAAVVLEVLILMVGILAAFQIDRWWEAHRDRVEEANYIDRLIADVEADLDALGGAAQLAEVRLGFAECLERVAKDAAAALERPTYFLAAVAEAAFTYTPSLASHTFDDLRSTGNLKLIRSETVTSALHDYHEFDDSQWQYVDLNLAIELRYFELSADILTLDQDRFLRDRWFVVTPATLEELDGAQPDEAEVKLAAERLRSNATLIAWLPRVRRLQAEQQLVHQWRLERAQLLLSALGKYQATLDG